MFFISQYGDVYNDNEENIVENTIFHLAVKKMKCSLTETSDTNFIENIISQMPYILVRGNLASYGHRYPWRVLVSGLKASDIEQLNRFPSGGYCDDSTIVYLQHPCVILTALEVLGYKVVASSSTTVKQEYNEYIWTMRKDFSEPEPEPVIKKGPLSSILIVLAELQYLKIGNKKGLNIFWI